MKKLFLGLLARLWVAAVFVYQAITALPFILQKTLEGVLHVTKVFLRLFIHAPFATLCIIVRSPRGTRKDRWIAWYLTRAYRLGRTLSVHQMKRINDCIEQDFIRKIRVPNGVDENQIIQWDETIEFVPRGDLEVRT